MSNTDTPSTLPLPPKEFLILFLTKLGLTNEAQAALLSTLSDPQHWLHKYANPNDGMWCWRVVAAVESAWKKQFTGRLHDDLTEEIIDEFGFTVERSNHWKRVLRQSQSSEENHGDPNYVYDLIEIAVRQIPLLEIWQSGKLVLIEYERNGCWCNWSTGERIE
jgi:hypothetical protein